MRIGGCLHAYATLSYILSLRGTEGLLLDLKRSTGFGDRKGENYSVFDNSVKREERNSKVKPFLPFDPMRHDYIIRN
jgi:hypothetical protein